MNNTTRGQRRGASYRSLLALVGVVVLLCSLFATGARAQQLLVLVIQGGTVRVWDEANAMGNLLGECTSLGGVTEECFVAGDVGSLEAVAAPGFFFDIWLLDCGFAGNNPLCNFNDMDRREEVLAVFAPLPPVTLNVVLAGSGQGVVQSDPQNPGVDCPGNCTGLYLLDTVVTLTATPTAPTSVFTGWQGAGCGGTGSCTVTMNAAQTVQANFESDTDGDGVVDPSDQCPATPAGEAVDDSGCSASEFDDDGDDVPNAMDQCPDTAAGEKADGEGCSDSQRDDDSDEVPNSTDQCPDTAAGENVDAQGCNDSQRDDDSDEVPNSDDQCPDTAAGENVDAQGCNDSQRDDDSDEVPNSDDQCPDTAAGENVDARGCSDSQRDDDSDEVPNSVDQCPDTPTGEAVDDQGCSDSQRDADSDGVPDSTDQCPATPTGAVVDPEGCSEVQLFGNTLGSLPGLGRSQQLLGARIDDICPRLIEEDAAQKLTEAQRDLRLACSRLKNRDTTQEQAITALNEISLSQLAALQDYMVELTHSQSRHLQARLREVKSGGGRGVSVAGLKLNIGNEQIPAEAIQSAFEGLLGMGGSEEPFADFGKLGIFLQGDISDGDGNGSGSESGYDFDSWNMTAGADYRFSETFFAGGSLSYGEVEVDYENQRGNTDVDQWALSLYGGWQLTDHWYLDGLLSYGESDIDLARNISYVDSGGPFDSHQRGTTDGEQLFLGLNTGYLFSRGGWNFGPIASLTYLDGSIDGYTETTHSGSAAWNFEVDERDIKSLRFSAGLQVDYAINTFFGVLVPGLRAAYVMESEDNDAHIKVRLANNPFADSTLHSDRIVVDVEPRDDAFFDSSLNLSAQFPMGISGFMSYQFYSAYDDFSRNAYTFGMRWDKPF